MGNWWMSGLRDQIVSAVLECANCSRHATATIVLRGGSAVGRWTCDLQVAGSIPSWWLSRNIGQLSLASLRGR